MVKVGEFVMYQPKPDTDLEAPNRVVSVDVVNEEAKGMVYEPAVALVTAIDDEGRLDVHVQFSKTRTPTAFGAFAGGQADYNGVEHGWAPGQYLERDER